MNLNINLPEDFFKAEERCGFTVSEKMKKVWAVQLDLINELQKVCDKHGLKFYAEGGTLLGCVRHKGYIPWDDDIDVTMLRSDYEKLCEVASEFNGDYFFQTTYTDELVRSHAQPRRNGTTALLKGDYKAGFHRGIFIDIFPVDEVPADKKEFESFKAELYDFYKKTEPPKKHLYRNNFMGFMKDLVFNTLVFPYRKIRNKSFLKKHGGVKNAFREFEEMAKRYNGKNTGYISLISFESATGTPAFIKKSEWYQDLTLYDYENIKLKAPKKAHEILTCQYGDYMTPVMGKCDHGGAFFDVEKDYKEYDKLTAKEFKKLFE